MKLFVCFFFYVHQATNSSRVVYGHKWILAFGDAAKGENGIIFFFLCIRVRGIGDAYKPLGGNVCEKKKQIAAVVDTSLAVVETRRRVKRTHKSNAIII